LKTNCIKFITSGVWSVRVQYKVNFKIILQQPVIMLHVPGTYIRCIHSLK